MSRELVQRKPCYEHSRDSRNTLAWMFTFSDLMLLLLTMFVMRLSMSTISSESLEKNLSHFTAKSTSFLSSKDSDTVSEEPSSLLLAAHKAASIKSPLLAALVDGLDQQLGHPELRHENGGIIYRGGIQVRSYPKSLVISLSGSSFSSDSNELSLRAAETLETISRIIRDHAVSIHIAAYAKNLAAEQLGFSSLWELTQVRAMAVLRQMIDAGVGTQCFSAVGYADTKLPEEDELWKNSTINEQIDVHIEESDSKGNCQNLKDQGI